MKEQKIITLKKLSKIKANPIAMIDSSWKKVFCVEMLNTNYLQLDVEDSGVYVTNQDYVGFFISFDDIEFSVDSEEFDLFCIEFQNLVQLYYQS